MNSQLRGSCLNRTWVCLKFVNPVLLRKRISKTGWHWCSVENEEDGSIVTELLFYFNSMKICVFLNLACTRIFCGKSQIATKIATVLWRHVKRWKTSFLRYARWGVAAFLHSPPRLHCSSISCMPWTWPGEEGCSVAPPTRRSVAFLRRDTSLCYVRVLFVFKFEWILRSNNMSPTRRVSWSHKANSI